MFAVITESVVCLLLLLFVVKWPVTGGLVTTAAAIGVAYELAQAGLGPLRLAGTVQGADVVGKKLMKAAVFAPEQPEGVRIDLEVPVPSHTKDQLLVEVRAAGLNPSNYKMVPAALPFVRHLQKWVVGYDVSGVVVSVGSSPACDFAKPGDAVWGFAMGSMAEYAVVVCEKAAKKPAVLTFEEAAALPVAALTSLEALERGSLKAGQHVLVIGASGGCGMFGVAIAKLMGAKVTAVCSTRNVDFVKNLGADVVVDYRSDADMQRLMGGGKAFDMVYDTVSSFDSADPNYEPSMGPLRTSNGTYVAINGGVEEWLRMMADWITSPLLKYRAQKAGYELFLLTPQREKMELLSLWFAEKKLSLKSEGDSAVAFPHVPIDSVFKLASDSQLFAAFERMKSRRTVGKIVLTL